jgi:hypothetical protein
MTPPIKRGFGVLAFFAISLLLAVGAHSDESQKPAPATASQSGAATTSTHPSQEQMAQETQTDPCQSMMGKMGMAQMGKGGPPGMGMMGMRPPGEMGMPGMGMPGMEMGGMGMMPMMHEHMMMRMMARNPKLAGKMLQMRADMMRAMADVMTKYGKEMESGQWPAVQGKGGEGD